MSFHSLLLALLLAATVAPLCYASTDKATSEFVPVPQPAIAVQKAEAVSPLPQPMSWRTDVSLSDLSAVAALVAEVFPLGSSQDDGLANILTDNILEDVNLEVARSLLHGPWRPTRSDQRTFLRKADGSTDVYQNGILSHAVRSGLAYTSDAEVTQESTPAEEVKVFIHDGNQGIKVMTAVGALKGGGKSIWISLRGSNNVQDWTRNIIAPKIPHSFRRESTTVTLHGAWLLTAKKIFAELKKRKLIPEDVSEIRLTGHSAGGGITQILHLLMADAGLPVLETVVFASPKITTTVGAKKLEDAGMLENVLRVSNRGDVVPDLLLDFGREAFKWAQAGPELIIDPQPDRIVPFLKYYNTGENRRSNLDISLDKLPGLLKNAGRYHAWRRTVILIARAALSQSKTDGGLSSTGNPTYQSVDKGLLRGLNYVQ